jgi:glycine oxidase
MSKGPTVIVAGAGALGLSAALALADAGCAVTVSDPGEPRASSVAAGMLAPAFECALEPETAPHADLLFAARNLWPGLAARAGAALDRSGALAVGDEAWLGEASAGLVRLGLRGAELGRTTIEALAPRLAVELTRGLLVREDWRLEPPAALAALRAACTAAGVQFRAARVTGRGEADVLVLATGYDKALAGLAPELSVLTPVRGQILRFMDERGGGVAVRTAGAYAVPGSDGLAFGATMEPGRDDLKPDPKTLQPLSAPLARLYPHLAQATFGWGVGVRAATPDGLPLAGPSAAPGVVLATGARRNGWLLAPLVAQLVTACVTGRDAGPFAARLDPRRFGEGA